MKKSEKEFIDEMTNFEGHGYGDPEARLNDDRKLNIILAKQQQRIQTRLNWLTFLTVIIALANFVALFFK